LIEGEFVEFAIVPKAVWDKTMVVLEADGVEAARPI
jgi:hypothetical protein